MSTTKRSISTISDPVSALGSTKGSICSLDERPKGAFFNPKGLSWFVTGLFVVGDLAGGGLVALPTAMIQSGFYFGIGVSIVMTIAVTYTAYVLGRCWSLLLKNWEEYHHHCRKPYPEIARRALGPIMQKIVSICIDVTQFGVAVVYILLSAKNIHDLIKAFWGGGISFCIVVLILAVVLLPVMFLKSPQDFWWAVVVAMITTSCAVILIIVGSSIDCGICAPEKKMPPFHLKNYFLALGTLLFAYGGHAAFPTIQHDMKNPKEFTKSTILAFTIMTLMYMPVSVMGFVVYGDSLRDSIIPSIQTKGIQQAINILITVHCILTLTIVFNPLSQEIEEIFKVPQQFGWQRVIVRTSIMVAVVFVAESIPNFGPLLDLVGGSTLTLTSIIFPCLFFLFLKGADKKREVTGIKDYSPCSLSDVFKYNNRFTLGLCCFIMAFGVIGGCAATFSAIVELTGGGFTPPCYVTVFQSNNDTISADETYCCGFGQNISHPSLGLACDNQNFKFYD